MFLVESDTWFPICPDMPRAHLTYLLSFSHQHDTLRSHQLAIKVTWRSWRMDFGAKNAVSEQPLVLSCHVFPLTLWRISPESKETSSQCLSHSLLSNHWNNPTLIPNEELRIRCQVTAMESSSWVFNPIFPLGEPPFDVVDLPWFFYSLWTYL